jgi:hypothetical protein
MRIVVHLTGPDPDALAAASAAIRAAGLGGDTQGHDDGRGFDWSADVVRDEHNWALAVNRMVTALGEALRHAATAGSVVQIEVEIGRPDRTQMNTHVGLAFQPEMLAQLGAWGISLAVTSALT